MKLTDQIEQNKRKIATDAYPMSIGEVVSLYVAGEIDIHPEFQRIYRWDTAQKSSLIESILLGIPLPSFFVSQRDDGIWDLVDGLQRLATILSFIGVYKDEDEKTAEPLKLEKTKYLNGLKDVVWDKKFGENALPIEIQRDFKRYKIDFKIIKKESDHNAKYDLFQRLNTGGTALEGQEVRNCLLIMVNKDAYDFITELACDPNFILCTPLTDRQVDESYRNELVLRFFVYLNMIKNDVNVDYGNVDSFLSEQMITIFNKDSGFDYPSSKSIFTEVFQYLSSAYGEDSFRKKEEGAHRGAFVLSRFEWICSYILAHKIIGCDPFKHLEKAIDELSTNSEFLESTKRGTGSLSRTKKLIKHASTIIV
ncbi:MAG: DUF262 domain-containing protein [Methyloprofundus sp.]|nr:DUF262 domain-containing protein [Methyloprofundus sp.]